MRAVILIAISFGLLAGPTIAAATPAQRHVRHHAHGWHIPRFDQGESEAYVHTVYPYRTGLYVPWPDAYGAPYPY